VPVEPHRPWPEADGDRAGAAAEVEHAHLRAEVGEEEGGPPVGGAASVGRAVTLGQEALVALPGGQTSASARAPTNWEW
jgi:hypothetical protein